MKTPLLCVLSLLVLAGTGCHAGTRNGAVREPAVAGQFYPADSTELRLAVTRYLSDALPKRVDKPVAIIVPHAGYVYSGQIAADAFRQVEGQPYDLIVILGTNHTTPGFRGVSVYTKGRFATPLGEMPIDEQAAEDLLKADKDCVFDPQVHAKEHSVEVEIPFVQQLFPAAKILPLVIGDPDLGLCTRLGKALAATLKDRKVLFVASSDLTHYPKYEDSRRVDKETLKAVASLDANALESAIVRNMSAKVPELVTCACGEGPILTAIAAAKELGALNGTVISYANSGDASVGEYGRVVGYGAVVFAANGTGVDTTALQRSSASDSAVSLTREDKKALLTLARKSIEWYLTSKTAPLPRGFGAGAKVREGAFVTLKENGELRGCIGHMAEDMPLCHNVGSMALAAAFEDTRFHPVSKDEIRKIKIEISALTPMIQVSGADQIRVGTDGVVIRKDGRSAVFLPQVATEQGWTREEMLNNLCLKAGLPSDTWKKNTQFYTFQAVVFSEDEF